MNFVSNIIWNSVEGFVEAGTRTAGGYAGDALLKAGDLIEGGGRSVGKGIERTASGYGNKLSSGAPAPPSAHKPAARSHSSPAATRTPVGTNKYPGGKQLPKQLPKQLTSTANKTVGGAQKAITGTGASATKTLSGATKALPSAYPNNVPYGTKTTPSSTASKKKQNASAPTYPGSALPSHNTTAPAKKTAVRPGAAPKPFTAPGANKSVAGAANKAEVKPYPGTNTLPGQSSRTPVKKYKPIPRMKAPVEAGGKVDSFFA